MSNWLIEVSLRNRFLVIALFALLAGWGWWALLTTPIDAIPDLAGNQVIVFTDWTGRSPQPHAALRGRRLEGDDGLSLGRRLDLRVGCFAKIAEQVAALPGGRDQHPFLRIQ